MEVIINIPDEMYDIIMQDTESEMHVIDVIKHGTPLPKGHGDLIDRDELFKEMRGRESCSKVLMAQAIIKADKGEE